MARQADSKRALVWLLTDGKPGHLNQLRGLGRQLERQFACKCIEVPAPTRAIWPWLLGANPCPGYAAPDLVIAAGSRTQPSLLAVKRYFRCPVVLLMRPNFPYGWFDAVIVPEHDKPPVRDNVLVTQGVINAIEPLARRDKLEQILLLIGGHSRHFGWDSPALIKQVSLLLTEHPSVQFVLSDSRRTPADFLPALQAALGDRLQVLHHTETPTGWLAQAMSAADAIWVTPDSVSMVYEAITSGRRTGIFDLPARGAGRITQGINALCDSGWLTRFSQRDRSIPASGNLWEAQRAARWLVARLFPGQ